MWLISKVAKLGKTEKKSYTSYTHKHAHTHTHWTGTYISKASDTLNRILYTVKPPIEDTPKRDSLPTKDNLKVLF